MKTCSKCLKETPDSDFYPCSLRCKKCCIEHQREWALKNPEKVKGYFKKFKTEKPEQYQASKRKYCNKNRELLAQKSNEWKKKNRGYWNNYIRDFKQRSPNYRISEILRSRIRGALKGIVKSSDTQSLLGCNYDEFRKYIESKFQEGMEWNNFGKWHIDHIKPCASFNLTDPSEQSKCFHYSNMQPLWAKENLTKHKKWNL